VRVNAPIKAFFVGFIDLALTAFPQTVISSNTSQKKHLACYLATQKNPTRLNKSGLWLVSSILQITVDSIFTLYLKGRY
jgi:hypothetical protein